MGDSYIIADKCIGTVDQSCVEVCPVNCIYRVGYDPEHPEEPYMLVIDPDECISCGACVPECPVEAISHEQFVPDKWQKFIEINYMHSGFGNGDGPEGTDPENKQFIADAAAEEHARLASVPS